MESLQSCLPPRTPAISHHSCPHLWVPERLDPNATSSRSTKTSHLLLLEVPESFAPSCRYSISLFHNISAAPQPIYSSAQARMLSDSSATGFSDAKQIFQFRYINTPWKLPSQSCVFRMLIFLRRRRLYRVELRDVFRVGICRDFREGHPYLEWCCESLREESLRFSYVRCVS